MSTVGELLRLIEHRRRLTEGLIGGTEWWRSVAGGTESVRELTGAHTPARTALVYLRCRRCGARVAAVEQDPDGALVTLWRGRRFRGVPRPIECAEHGHLRLDAGALAGAVAAARRTGRPRTLKLAR